MLKESRVKTGNTRKPSSAADVYNRTMCNKASWIATLLLVASTLPLHAEPEPATPPPENTSPTRLDWDALSAEHKTAYTAMLAAMDAAMEGQAGADLLVEKALTTFAGSQDPVVQAFVPLLTGLQQRERGELDLAVGSLSDALKRNPAELLADYQMGLNLWDLRRLAEGEAHLKRFLDGTAHLREGAIPDPLYSRILGGTLLYSRLALDQQDLEKSRTLLARSGTLCVEGYASSRQLVTRLEAADRVREKGPSNWDFGKGGNAWKATSKHYLIMTDVSEACAKELAGQAEAAYKLYVRELAFLGKVPEKAPFPVIVFKSESGFHKFNEHLTGDPHQSVVGYFDPMSKFLVLWNDRAMGGQLAKTAKDVPEVYQTLYHEGLHQYLDLVSGEIPHWINEGIASMFENLQVAGGAAKIIKDQDFIEYIQDIAQGVENYGTGAFKNTESIQAMAPTDRMAYPYFCIYQYFLKESDPKGWKDLLLAMRKGVTDDRRLAAMIYGKKGQEATDKAWQEYCKKMHR